MAFMI